jgi:hypothetical protein
VLTENRADRRSSRDERYREHGSCRATVKRSSLAEDGFRQLNHEGPRLKGRIKIAFIDQYVFPIFMSFEKIAKESDLARRKWVSMAVGCSKSF